MQQCPGRRTALVVHIKEESMPSHHITAHCAALASSERIIAVPGCSGEACPHMDVGSRVFGVCVGAAG